MPMVPRLNLPPRNLPYPHLPWPHLPYLLPPVRVVQGKRQCLARVRVRQVVQVYHPYPA